MEEKTENWWCLQTPVLRGLETICSLLQLLQIGFESFSKTIEPVRSRVKTLSFPLRDKFFHFLPEPLRSGGTLFQLFLVGFDHLLFQVGILSDPYGICDKLKKQELFINNISKLKKIETTSHQSKVSLQGREGGNNHRVRYYATVFYATLHKPNGIKSWK